MFEYLNPLHQLVRVRHDGQEFNVGRATAIADKLEILEDESAYDAAGAPREVTRTGGRPVKPRVSVAEKAAEKAASSADTTDNPTSPKE